jgi:hypothetical protein
MEGNPGAGNAGLATPTTVSTGLFGWGSGALTKVDILVRAGLSTAEKNRTIMHELGHALRLAHTAGANDVMNSSNTATTPSANDVAEALAADKDPPCPFAILSNLLNYLKKGDTTTVTLVPKPQSGINLNGVTAVNITSLTGPDFQVAPGSITWTPTSITALFDVFQSAEHNEVFNVQLTYANSTTADYTGVLTITPTDATPGAFPHAVTSGNIVVTEGDTIFLDGTASYHDDPTTLMFGSWMTSGGPGLFSESGYIFLPAGTYDAAYQLMDYYGRISTSNITITVLPANNIPTLDQWGLIILALILLSIGAIFLARRARALKREKA